MGVTSAPSMRVVAPLMFLVAFADSLVYAITAPVIPHVGREVGMTDTSILAAFFGIGAAATDRRASAVPARVLRPSGRR